MVGSDKTTVHIMASYHGEYVAIVRAYLHICLCIDDCVYACLSVCSNSWVAFVFKGFIVAQKLLWYMPT